MKITDLTDEISRLNPHRLNHCNVLEIVPLPNGDLYLETNAERVEELKQDIADNEAVIKRMEEEGAALDQENDKLRAEVEGLRATLADIKDGSRTVADILEELAKAEKQGDDARRQWREWHAAHQEQARELAQLRARKNKATVSRCRTTGKLLATYDGKTFTLTPQ
jgi:chromosome segregation ATPase